MSVTIYHNPKCSKSRQTLKLLEERGIRPTIIEYLRTPPSPTDLECILVLLKLEPRQLMRQKEPEYQRSGAANPGLGRDALTKLMVQHPILIERPIVLANDRAALGRPPENVLAIL